MRRVFERGGIAPLWGKQITVEGMVHFKANGQAKLIKARRISSRLEKDGVFEEMPSAEVQEPHNFFRTEWSKSGLSTLLNFRARGLAMNPLRNSWISSIEHSDLGH